MKPATKHFMQSSSLLRGGLMLMIVAFAAIPITLIAYKLDPENGFLIAGTYGALCTLGGLIAFTLSSMFPGEDGAKWAILFSGFFHTGPVLVVVLILSQIDEMWKSDAAKASILAFYFVTLISKTVLSLPNYQKLEDDQ
jgi:hypothetical protein